jgi:Putative lumazine-binding
MRLFIFLFLIVFQVLDFKAQTNQDSLDIMKPINAFFLGMKQLDTTLIHQQLHPSLNYLRTFRKNKNGETKIDSTRVHDFMKAIVKDKSAQLEEKIYNPKLLMDDILASVWVDYEFWYNGKFSHSGVDVFTLIKVNAIWQIAAIVDTRKRPK